MRKPPEILTPPDAPEDPMAEDWVRRQFRGDFDPPWFKHWPEVAAAPTESLAHSQPVPRPSYLTVVRPKD